MYGGEEGLGQNPQETEKNNKQKNIKGYENLKLGSPCLSLAKSIDNGEGMVCRDGNWTQTRWTPAKISTMGRVKPHFYGHGHGLGSE